MRKNERTALFALRVNQIGLEENYFTPFESLRACHSATLSHSSFFHLRIVLCLDEYWSFMLLPYFILIHCIEVEPLQELRYCRKVKKIG